MYFFLLEHDFYNPLFAEEAEQSVHSTCVIVCVTANNTGFDAEVDLSLDLKLCTAANSVLFFPSRTVAIRFF